MGDNLGTVLSCRCWCSVSLVVGQCCISLCFTHQPTTYVFVVPLFLYQLTCGLYQYQDMYPSLTLPFANSECVAGANFTLTRDNDHIKIIALNFEIVLTLTKMVYIAVTSPQLAIMYDYTPYLEMLCLRFRHITHVW